MTDAVKDWLPRLSSAERAWLSKLQSQMQSMDAVQSALKMLLYGESGVGKTVEAVHIAQIITPPDKTILYIDSDQNWVSLKNYPELKRRVTYMRITSADQLENIADAVRAGMEKFTNVGAIVVDEHSSIADYDLLAVAKAKALISTDDKDPDQPTQPDMGVNTNRINKYTAPLIQLPTVHVFLIAHERQDKDNIGRVRTAPSYMPKLSSTTRRMVHVVARMTADEVTKDGKVSYRRELQVNPTKQIIAKTRIGGLPVRLPAGVFIKAALEWLGGTRPTQTVDVIHEDEGEKPATSVEDQADTDESTSEDL